MNANRSQQGGNVPRGSNDTTLARAEKMLHGTGVLLEQYQAYLPLDIYAPLAAQQRSYLFAVLDEIRQRQNNDHGYIEKSLLLSEVYTHRDWDQDTAKTLLWEVQQHEDRVLAATKPYTREPASAYAAYATYSQGSSR
ncbi:hypothetical protein FS749_008038 [Ceratobasidium sp. UAMH 11750]|nr:hypothetical protein FS749_008038 [Ceratobasidium sp. UAMH 11750]